MKPIPLAEWRPAVPGVRPVIPAQARPQPLPAHVGVWLDRCLPAQGDDGSGEAGSKGWPGRRNLYEVAVEALAPGSERSGEPPAVAAYRAVFRRWRHEMEKERLGFSRRIIELEATSRLLLHPASNSTVTEGAILLHHTYGVPYLPGSALKGAMRCRLRAVEPATPVASDATSWAAELLGRVPTRAEGGEAKALASLVDFTDALWIPERPARVRPGWSPLALDVVNPHHPHYYTSNGGPRESPTDYDEPIPVHRLTVAPGTRWLAMVEIAASPIVEPWLDWLVDSVLVPALAEDGIGAWTATGYGRLRRVEGSSGQEGRSSTHSRPTAGQAAGSVEWHAAYLYRIAGNGELVAILGDNRRAAALRKTANELLESLPEEMRKRLTAKGKRREVRGEVQVAREGTSWRLVAVRPRKEDASS